MPQRLGALIKSTSLLGIVLSLGWAMTQPPLSTLGRATQDRAGAAALLPDGVGLRERRPRSLNGDSGVGVGDVGRAGWQLQPSFVWVLT